MRILFAAHSGNSIILGRTRAPDQAQRRLSAALGAPVAILWVGMPVAGVDSAILMEAVVKRLGKVSTLVDGELGTVALVRSDDCRSADCKTVGAAIKEVANTLKKPASPPTTSMMRLAVLIQHFMGTGLLPTSTSSS